MIVKDAQSGTAIEVFWSTLERSLELFKTKSFAELFNATYIPLAVRQESRAFSAGLTESLTGEKVNQPSPKIEDNNSSSSTTSNTNSKDFSQYK